MGRKAEGEEVDEGGVEADEMDELFVLLLLFMEL